MEVCLYDYKKGYFKIMIDFKDVGLKEKKSACVRFLFLKRMYVVMGGML